MTGYPINELVPQSGRMSLLDKVIEYNEEYLRAEITIRKESMFVDEKGVPAWIGLEYMAQTVAAYSGWKQRLKQSEPKLGFLLGTRRYHCSTDYFLIGSTLTITAKKNMIAENGLTVFYCELHGEDVNAVAEMNVFHPENPDNYLQGLK